MKKQSALILPVVSTAHKKRNATRQPKVFTWTEIPSGHSNKAVGGFSWIREHRHDNLDRGCCCCCCGYFTRIFVWSECVSLALQLRQSGNLSRMEPSLCPVYIAVIHVKQSVGCRLQYYDSPLDVYINTTFMRHVVQFIWENGSHPKKNSKLIKVNTNEQRLSFK